MIRSLLKTIHQCVFCAIKEDNIFEVHDFILEANKLYLKANDQKLLIYTKEIEERMPEPEGGGFRHLVVRFWLHTTVVSQEADPMKSPNLGVGTYFRGAQNERIFPDNPNIVNTV